MEPQPGNPQEVEGVLNPAAAQGRDGHLYLFPRLVARGTSHASGLPASSSIRPAIPAALSGLESRSSLRQITRGDPTVVVAARTFVEPLRRYVMTYAALSSIGPRIAFAISEDLFHWRRLGLATFASYHGIDFVHVDNKDASVFPAPIANHAGKLQLALLHRPLFPGTRPEDTARLYGPRDVDLDHESIWISYCPMPATIGETQHLGLFNSHHRLAAPVAPWARLKVGAGTPPILTRHGWLVIYHGVSETTGLHDGTRHLCYSAGLMVLSVDHPRNILYRSAEPVLTPILPLEPSGTVANVVFPTGIDRRDDLGSPDRFDV